MEGDFNFSIFSHYALVKYLVMLGTLDGTVRNGYIVPNGLGDLFSFI